MLKTLAAAIVATTFALTAAADKQPATLLTIEADGTVSRDQGPAGECGGVAFLDDPELDFRTYVIRPNPEAGTDLNFPGAVLQLLAGDCLKIEMVLVSHKVETVGKEAEFACAAIVAGKIPGCVVAARQAQ